MDDETPNTSIVARPHNTQLAMAGAQALVQRTLGEVQIAVMMAKQFPRDKIAAKEQLLMDCTREGLASVAMYSYSRGGTEITGASIRLAEAAKRAWGNMQSGWREIARSVVNGVGISEVEAFAWDTENNTRESLCFTVRHWRDTKKGGYALTDERDIYELCANQAARRERACILKMIDGDVIEDALKQCNVTLNTKITATPDRIKNLVKIFADEFGVTEAQIEKRVQRRVETINGAVVVSLTKIYNSMKDGMSKPSDWFEPEEDAGDNKEAKKGNAGVKEKLAKKAEAAGANPETGEIEPKQKAESKPEPVEEPKAEAQPAQPPVAADFNTKLIGMKGKEGDATQPDYEAWQLEFMKRCNSAPNLELIGELYKNNVKMLNQMKTRAIEIYQECDDCYQDNIARLEGQGE